MKRSAFALSAALLALPLAAGAAGPATAQSGAPAAQAVLMNPNGDTVGLAEFEQGPEALLVIVKLSDMPPGWHALHIHQVGDCSDPEAGFKASGGHLGVDSAHHGFLAEGGPHPGDLPNILVHSDGTAEIHAVTSFARMNGEGPGTVLDDDGAAVVIHSNADDYRTDPAGEGGERLACGVIEET
jgi:Cu-Zn family superoxide dismutase